ncbi:MAG: RidA family protein [Azospirillaceae bacterium]
MAGKIESRLAELGITLPAATAPAANYVPFVFTGNQLWVSGQIPMIDGNMPYKGRLGDSVPLEDGQAAARLCALNIVAQVKEATGDLDRVARFVKLVGFVNTAPGFGDQPKVVNGASDTIVEIFGDKGRHARSAVGVAGLPFDVAVEVEAVVELA